MALLEIKDLWVEYKAFAGIVKAINGFSFSVENGEAVGLVGETGAGKTTVALSIMGMLPKPAGRIVAGSITYKEMNLGKLPQAKIKAIRGKEIAMIFQNPLTCLNPVFTVGMQIATIFNVRMNMPKNESYKEAMEMLETVGIPGRRASDYPHQLSGGMRQRVGIAMALAFNPALIIADEPTTALDVTIQAQVLELMKDLKKQYDMSLIMITHNLGIVSELCEKVIVMYAGNVLEVGSVEDVFTNPRHPYTIGLFNSLPDLVTKQDRLITISGTMPNPLNLPDGCKFYPRCPKVKDQCKKEIPPATQLNENHTVSCFAL